MKKKIYLIISLILITGIAVFVFYKYQSKENGISIPETRELSDMGMSVAVPDKAEYMSKVLDKYTNGGLTVTTTSINDELNNELTITSSKASQELKDFVKSGADNQTGGGYIRVTQKLDNKYTHIGEIDGEKIYRVLIENKDGDKRAIYYSLLQDNEVTWQMNILGYDEDPEEVNIILGLNKELSESQELEVLNKFDKIVLSLKNSQ